MPWFRRVLWAELVTALLMVVNIGLLGLPGLFIASPVEAILSAFDVKVSGDAIWPIGIWVGWLMPFGFLLGTMRGKRLHPDQLFEVVSFGILGYLGTGILSAAALLLLSGRS